LWLRSQATLAGRGEFSIGRAHGGSSQCHRLIRRCRRVSLMGGEPVGRAGDCVARGRRLRWRVRRWPPARPGHAPLRQRRPLSVQELLGKPRWVLLLPARDAAHGCVAGCTRRVLRPPSPHNRAGVSSSPCLTVRLVPVSSFASLPSRDLPPPPLTARRRPLDALAAARPRHLCLRHHLTPLPCLAPPPPLRRVSSTRSRVCTRTLEAHAHAHACTPRSPRRLACLPRPST